ncbi:MAG: tetratricopeptide repeat protein [Acidimicrobiia bacterium]
MSDREREQIELLREELDEVTAQVRDGDLDEDTALEIRTRYEAELAALEASAASARSTLVDGAGTDEDSPRRRLNGRAVAGIALVTVAMVVIGVFAVQSLSNRRIVGADGIVGDVVRGEGQVDLSTITNEEMEEVVAANPDIVPMRLALARRYFEEGVFDKALNHYFEILNREQNPEALANVGWMTYLSGRPDIAVNYLEAALERRPDFLSAEWFLGNIYVSLERDDEAAFLLTKVASSNEVPESVKESAIALLEQIGEDGS